MNTTFKVLLLEVTLCFHVFPMIKCHWKIHKTFTLDGTSVCQSFHKKRNSSYNTHEINSGRMQYTSNFEWKSHIKLATYSPSWFPDANISKNV